MTIPRTRPDASEYPQFFAGYMASVPDDDVVALLKSAGQQATDALSRVTEERGGYRYAEGKWSIRTMLGHLSDTERVFTYRALRLARGDTTPLPGFDEKSFAASAESDSRTMADLVREFSAVRASSVLLFETLPDAAWTRGGMVNNGSVSVRALAYITAGHTPHHLRVLPGRDALTTLRAPRTNSRPPRAHGGFFESSP